MKSEVIISILIPMYNASSTIIRCLKSLCSQSPRIFEIVIIDDGSRDKSYKTVFDYVEKYSFVRLYKQNNQGIANTRQNLIDYAQGEYILFCDADDYFEKDTVRKVYDLICDNDNKDIELFIFGYNLIQKIGKKSIKHRGLNYGVYEKDQFANYHIKGISDLYWSALWNKCYRKSLLCKLNIHFNDLLEDVMFNVDYISKCEKICISNKTIYNYVQIGESITRTKRIDNETLIKSSFDAYKLLEKKLKYAYPECKNQIDRYIYEFYWNLHRRAVEIKNSNIDKIVLNECNNIKRNVGGYVFFIKIKIRIKYIKNNLKKQFKIFLFG